jgi:hypothetical protein
MEYAKTLVLDMQNKKIDAVVQPTLLWFAVRFTSRVSYFR